MTRSRENVEAYRGLMAGSLQLVRAVQKLENELLRKFIPESNELSEAED